MHGPRLLNTQPYEGEDTELIIGIDVGTTFSGVCYTFLRPGKIPEIWSVQRFTGQTNGDHKVPSIVYYDKALNVRAAGATAVSREVVEEADCEEWIKAQYFKVFLRPIGMYLDTHGLELGTLPPSKTPEETMSDFLRYLYTETIIYIKERHSDSKSLLDLVSGRIKFVLCFPNGWAGLPQQRMREAAVLGGLVDDSISGRSRISFVSEGEASALSCLAEGLCPSNLHPGYRFMIADLGGATLDMTSYEVTCSSPIHLKELTASDCRFAGSIFVNRNARELIQQKLRGSQYDNPEILDDIMVNFENHTKREFRNAAMFWRVRVGAANESNTALNIRQGSLRLRGTELADPFMHSINNTLSSIRSQVAACGGKPMPVWLVGGLAKSPWMFERLREELEPDGIAVSRPETDIAKAAAHGSILFAVEHPVRSRMTRFTYGIKCSTRYDASNSEHLRRSHLKSTHLSGYEIMPGTFDAIVNKNILINEDQTFAQSYYREIQNKNNATLSVALLCFDKTGTVPEWYDENKDKFRQVCTITADLTRVCRPANFKKHNDKSFWRLDFECEVLFGLTELRARLKWEEDGETKYGPATVFFEK